MIGLETYPALLSCAFSAGRWFSLYLKIHFRFRQLQVRWDLISLMVWVSQWYPSLLSLNLDSLA